MKLTGGPALCLIFTLLLTQSVFAKTYHLNSRKELPSQFKVNKEKGDNIWSLKLTTSSFEADHFKEFPLSGSYQTIKFPLLKNFEKAGAPALPFKSFIVQGHKEDLKFKMRRSGEHTFSDLTVAPAPLKPCRCVADKQQGNSFSLNDKDYKQTAKNLYEVVELGDFRGVALSKVILRPAVQSSKGLVVYEEIELVVESSKGLTPPPIRGQNDKFLMITPKKLLTSARSFRDYKESQGFEVDLVEFESVAKDSKELKEFIHARYNKDSFQYALLFGHENILPTIMVETSSNLQTPSDFPYFAMGGDGDVLPDVFYGRITADNNKEVLGQLEKIREYNDRSWSSQSGVYRSLGIASNEGWQPTDVEYMRSMLSPIERELAIAPDYFFQDDPKSKPDLINRSLNQGVRWMNYIGHGSGDSWSSVYGREYLSAHVKKLKSDVVKPIIIDVACQNGRFNNAGKLGETFMNARNRGRAVGAVAYYGGSVDISWDPPAVMAMRIGEELSKQKVESLYALILRGQFLLLQEYGDPEAAKENLLWYHLLGDPSLSVTLP
jgi:hypothetical protein